MTAKLHTVPLLGACLFGVLLLGLNGQLQAASAPGMPPAARIRAPIDESARVELPGHVHPAVRDSVDLGPADPSLRAQRLTLVLRAGAAQEAALAGFLRDVQTPGHPDYHRWLTPATFAQRFGVAATDLATLQSWLRAKGFGIDEVPAGGRSIVFSGTVRQLSQAFAIAVHRYDWHGQKHLAAANNPSVPAALGAVVRGFASLHDFRLQPQLTPAQTQPAYNAGGQNFLAPSDFAVIYDLNGPYQQGLTGSGQSVAVLGRSSVATADLATFRSSFGLSANPPQIINNGPAPGLVAGDELESDLDLEWSGAVAPAASIKFVTSASTYLSDGIDLSAQYAVSHNVAGIITLSYSACESHADLGSGAPYYQQLWQQAASQGISVFVVSGDSGAAGCDADSSSKAVAGLGVNALCSSPESTCVGGTEFTADAGAQGLYWSSVSNSASAPPGQATALRYIGEAAWNQSGSVSGGSALYASGGGASMYYAKPAWQYATGVPSDGLRDVPDLALAAAGNHDAYLVYTSDGYSATTLVSIGGTSAASPSMAGMAALVAQSRGERLGNVNPVLYGLSNQQAAGAAAVFHRITSGNNSVPGQVGFSASASDASYNQVTGLGSVDGASLIANWGTYVPQASTLSPSSVLVPSGEYAGAATLTLPTSTPWSATVDAAASAWLSVSPQSGTGPAVLTYLALANGATATRSGTITVNGLQLAVSQAAAAGGSGNLPQTSLTPVSLAFGNSPVGVSSASQRVLLGNAGNLGLTVGAISVVGAQAADFAVAGSCQGVGTLDAGASCYLDLTFTPAGLGARAAALRIASNAPGSPASVALAGTGSAASASTSADVPLPPWAYALLAAGLLRVIWSFRRGAQVRA